MTGRCDTCGSYHTPLPATAEKPGHPFGAIFAGTVDTRRPKTDGGPSVTEFLRSKGEM